MEPNYEAIGTFEAPDDFMTPRESETRTGCLLGLLVRACLGLFSGRVWGALGLLWGSPGVALGGFVGPSAGLFWGCPGPPFGFPGPCRASLGCRCDWFGGICSGVSLWSSGRSLGGRCSFCGVSWAFRGAHQSLYGVKEFRS